MEKLFSSMEEILNPENKIVYKIPEFQREYAWGKDQWRTLFDDLIENEVGYFIGSIICISGKPDTQNSVIPYTVIDGQQRLTTISILLLAILDDLIKNKIVDNYDTESDEFDGYRAAKKMIRHSPKDIDALRLILQESNFQDYNYLIGSVFEQEYNRIKYPPYFGNRRIKSAFNFFAKQIEDLPVNDKFDLLNKTRKTKVVSINVEDESKAFILFEALNNRGLPLSIVDLVNNKLIQESSSPKVNQKDYCHACWMETKQNIGDDPGIQERFLRHYYNALIRQPNEKDNKKITKAGKGNLLKLYKEELEERCVELTEDLLTASRIYAKISTSSDNIEESYKNDLIDLFHADGTTSYALLLYLFKNKDVLGLKDEDIKKVIKSLVNFFLIRSLTEKPLTRKMDDMFMEIMDKLTNMSKTGAQKDEIISCIISTLKKYQSVTVDDIKKELEKDVYLEYAGAIRFFLAYFETNSDGDKGKDYNRYWYKDKKGKKLEWTIEHVLPETKGKLREEWVKMLAGPGRYDEAKEIQEKYTHKLGNLTLTPYNSELSDKPLNEKQNAGQSKGGYKATNLFLNRDMNSKIVTPIMTAEKWGPDEIDKRTSFLVSRFLKKIYPIDNEINIYVNVDEDFDNTNEN